MTKVKVCVVIIAFFLLLTMARSANATVIYGNQWFEYWEDYHDYEEEGGGGAQNASTTVRLGMAHICLTFH